MVKSGFDKRFSQNELDTARILHRVWERVQKIPSYSFKARMEVTLVPRAVPGMRGEHDQHITLLLEGKQTAPDRSRMTLRLADAPDNVLLAVEREGSRVILQNGGQRVERQLPVDPTALTSNFLDYLQAATDVRQVPTAESAHRPADQVEEREDLTFYVSRFTYRIDGQRLARLYTERIVDQLRRAAQAPDLKLDPAAVVASVNGTGELSVDERGLPARQVLDLNLPAGEYYTTRAHVVVEYAFPVGATHASPPPGGPVGGKTGTDVGATGRSPLQSPRPNGGFVGARHALPLQHATNALLVAFPPLMALLLIAYRRRHRAYAALVLTVILAMVTTPTLRALNISRVYSQMQQLADGDQQIAVSGQHTTLYASRITHYVFRRSRLSSRRVLRQGRPQQGHRPRRHQRPGRVLPGHRPLSGRHRLRPHRRQGGTRGRGMASGQRPHLVRQPRQS